MTTDTTQPRVEDGGPASGMSLRDYFAAAALTSMLSEPSRLTDSTPDIAATWSYRLADAMLRARSEGGR